MNYLLLPLLSKSAPGYSAQQIVLNFYFAKKEEEEEENNQRKRKRKAEGIQIFI